MGTKHHRHHSETRTLSENIPNDGTLPVHQKPPCSLSEAGQLMVSLSNVQLFESCPSKVLALSYHAMIPLLGKPHPFPQSFQPAFWHPSSGESKPHRQQAGPPTQEARGEPGGNKEFREKLQLSKQKGPTVTSETQGDIKYIQNANWQGRRKGARSKSSQTQKREPWGNKVKRMENNHTRQFPIRALSFVLMVATHRTMWLI